MEVVLVPFLKAIPGGQLTKHCYLEAYKFLMNTWNALPRPYRIRVHNNTLALVKNRILAADTAVKNAPVSTEAAQVDEQLLEEFLESTAPLDEPQIGSRNDDNDMPGDIDAYEEFVTYDHGESFDFGGDGEPSVPHAEPEMDDEIRKIGRRRRRSNVATADENDSSASDGHSDIDHHTSEGDSCGRGDDYEDATQGEGY